MTPRAALVGCALALVAVSGGAARASMMGHLKAIPAAEAERLRAQPARVAKLIGAIDAEPPPENPKIWAELRPFVVALVRMGVRHGLTANESVTNAKAIYPRFRGDLERERQAIVNEAAKGATPIDDLAIDKAWHGIHFLLTGAADGGPRPWRDVILGGEPIGRDVGYGPARLLSPSLVKEIAAALNTLKPGELRARFDAAKMEKLGIYPTGWDASRYAWLEEKLNELRAYYARAASRGEAILIWLD